MLIALALTGGLLVAWGLGQLYRACPLAAPAGRHYDPQPAVWAPRPIGTPIYEQLLAEQAAGADWTVQRSVAALLAEFDQAMARL